MPRWVPTEWATSIDADAGRPRRSWRRRALAVLLAGVGTVGLAALLIRFGLDRTNRVVLTEDGPRPYLLYVPATYDAATATPLVLSFHGAALWPASQRKTSGWNEIADREGILVVYPAGHGVPRVWHGGPAARGRDVRYVRALLDSLAREFNVDATRIYADGLSNGARMAMTLTCELPGRIAAVGLVAGAFDVPWSACPDTTPVPAVAFHGTDDALVPYRGGESWVAPAPFPPIEAWMARWAERNRCGGSRRETVAADVVRTEWTECAAPVQLYSVEGGGHTWPGLDDPLPEFLAGRTTRSIDATEIIWRFFRANPLPDEPTRVGGAGAGGP